MNTNQFFGLLAILISVAGCVAGATEKQAPQLPQKSVEIVHGPGEEAGEKVDETLYQSGSNFLLCDDDAGPVLCRQIRMNQRVIRCVATDDSLTCEPQGDAI